MPSERWYVDPKTESLQHPQVQRAPLLIEFAPPARQPAVG